MSSEYEAVLQRAIQAAQDAGALLREEFLRPHGPRGNGDHADIDEPAEEEIRRQLLSATPEWSYRGEETGYRQGTDAHYIWLVDPNDGTSAYLGGWRGSAVSIALLRDGLPVLGVVYAFAAPDNNGDLFSWAEGLPLRRNGVTVDRGPWATHLTEDTVIVISQSADRAAPENLRCVQPARYRAQPSIAYRLALVAAGEGESGVGLSGPIVQWDYAGGHALIRGSGGDVVDDRGQGITYTADGRSRAMSCFGGAPLLVRELAGRPWTEALRAGRRATRHQHDLSQPERGKSIARNDRLQRGQGCWLGQLSGDALGSMVEFESGTTLGRRYPHGLRDIGPSSVWNTLAGQPTDDSELALALARTLLRDGAYDAEKVAGAYCWWRNSSPFDVGGTIGAATGAMLRAEERGESRVEAADGHANGSSQANGALMRQSPLAIWGACLPPGTLDLMVRADTRLTHPHTVCQDASAAFCISVAATIREGLDGEGAYARACEWDAQQGSSPAVTQALKAARDEPADYGHHAGWVLVALQNAFYQALHAESFEEGVAATVMGGGDTDTNAAIAGALLGAIHGVSSIPSQWRQAVLTCRPQQGLSGVYKPRPRAFWPVDALILAERLLVLGEDHVGASS